MSADGRDQSRGEVPPVIEVCWKCGPDFGGAELEQSVTRATGEGAFEPAQQLRRRLDSLVPGRQKQVAPRGQCERRHENGWPFGRVVGNLSLHLL